jgi:hypothetical protein
VRAFGSHLVAGNITVDTVAYPHAVRWSHPAEPGTVPSSWDIADPATQAGEGDLADPNSSGIIDMVPLQNRLFVYKDGSIWYMTRIGGRFVFDIKQFLSSTGILAPRCVVALPDGLRHVVAVQDDIIIHNGTSVESLLDKRMKKYLFGLIDPLTYVNSFMFVHPLYNEVWFCYPTIGNTYPNRALIWNYKHGTRGVFTEASGINFRNAASGQITTPDSRVWDTVATSWDAQLNPWEAVGHYKTVLSNPTASKLLELDSGLTRDGVAFEAYVRRQSLSIVGKKRDGTPVEDFSAHKLWTKLWPKVLGGPVNVRVGSQALMHSAISWSASLPFDPATSLWVDETASGVSLAVEFATTDSVAWRIDGYKFEVEKLGMF